MQSTDDNALLREYTENHSDEAFAALVAKYINLVYSIAIRSIGNSSGAEEITQAVFIIFAQKAGQLRNGKALSSWLFKTTQLTANNFLRSEMRRQRREQEAYDMQTILSEPEPELWPKIAPLLDTAVAALKEKDRRAILLRFYEGKNLQEIGTALGVSEVAVEKRVSRAIEKLQKFFFKRGVTSTAKVITATISANSVQAAPAALVKTITAVALAKGATASLSTLTLVKAATIKSAATFGAGSIGGLFAVFGSAYVSLKAHADESKSPRERQFMVRMFRIRATAYLLWLAVYVIAAKFNFFCVPICFDFFLAAFIFYFFCIGGMILAREQGLRRRQIQIEDNTYVEAEWTMPRKVTDPTVDPVNVKNLLKALRFWIFVPILGYAIWFEIYGHHLYQAWKLRLKFPVVERAFIFAVAIMAAGFVVSIYTRFLQWQKRPRFMPIRGDGPTPRGLVVFPIMFPIVIGLMTLAVFGIHEHWANDGYHDSVMLSPNEVLVFYGVVVAVYTAFTIRTIGILAKRRKHNVDKK